MTRGAGRYRLRKPQAIDFTLSPPSSFIRSPLVRIVRHRNRFVVRRRPSNDADDIEAIELSGVQGRTPPHFHWGNS